MPQQKQTLGHKLVSQKPSLARHIVESNFFDLPRGENYPTAALTDHHTLAAETQVVAEEQRQEHLLGVQTQEEQIQVVVRLGVGRVAAGQHH